MSVLDTVNVTIQKGAETPISAVIDGVIVAAFRGPSSQISASGTTIDFALDLEAFLEPGTTYTIRVVANDPDDSSPALDESYSFTTGASFASTPELEARAVNRLITRLKEVSSVVAMARIFSRPFEEVRLAARAVRGAHGIETATGAQLDALGASYGEQRSGQTDRLYRNRVRAQAAVVGADGSVNDVLDVAIAIDDGFQPGSIAFSPHWPAGGIITMIVPQGQRLIGEDASRIARKAVAEGVYFAVGFEEQDTELFEWSDSPNGEGWADIDDIPGTGGKWSEQV